MAQVPLFTPQGYSYKHIAATGTLAVKAYPGVLRRVMINSATNGSVVTFYDNTAGSGTVLAIYTFGAAVTTPTVVQYDVAFATGLTIVVATQNCDLTILYS